MAFTKYKVILKLEERHGVHFNDAYRLDDACKLFVHAINDSIADELKTKLCNSKFIGVMADGSTDSSITDQEASFVIYFDPSPPNEDRDNVVTAFLGIINGKVSDISGVLDSIKQAFRGRAHIHVATRNIKLMFLVGGWVGGWVKSLCA